MYFDIHKAHGLYCGGVM